jgi:2-methylisocitrate lyase-like PEP mutase family enzyme
MSKCKILYEQIQARAALPVPGVYDAFSALLVEQAGFLACQVSGAALSASTLGLPDLGFLSLRDQINAVQSIANAVSIPVMADGDTGYGNALNTFHTVRLLESAGAAGINLEDQTFPKRCGHLDGKSVIPMHEMVQKIRAAVAARRDPHFVINARTDAIATDGAAAAITRGNAYLEAGASLIFIEAPRSRDELIEIVKRVNGPVSVSVVSSGKSPMLNLSELREIGVARVSYPGITIASAGMAMRRALQELAANGDLAGIRRDVMSFAELGTVVRLSEEKARDQEYAS